MPLEMTAWWRPSGDCLEKCVDVLVSRRRLSGDHVAIIWRHCGEFRATFGKPLGGLRTTVERPSVDFRANFGRPSGDDYRSTSGDLRATLCDLQKPNEPNNPNMNICKQNEYMYLNRFTPVEDLAPERVHVTENEYV